MVFFEPSFLELDRGAAVARTGTPRHELSRAATYARG
jgi:hypothetical protein